MNKRECRNIGLQCKVRLRLFVAIENQTTKHSFNFRQKYCHANIPCMYAEVYRKTKDVMGSWPQFHSNILAREFYYLEESLFGDMLTFLHAVDDNTIRL